MAIMKCKMCGGDLSITEGNAVTECEYCGTLQTVPNGDNEKKLTLFNRANRLRLACEFDKAAGIYETIVADFPEEAEAYWGLVLCKYGIEYVDDPATGKKIPTCHRSSFDSIMEDSDFEQALENADVVARKVYRDEAKAIEEIRKGIIAVSSGEEPYDIFICYKETAEDGQRTLDSVLAQDLYDTLTDKNYRVFFARITLEDKLGQEYEPYIFAALNSAKIMLAIGTDYEYYNAVWVKNEWSRFLKLMAKDKEKHLIPCYKGIDAYDMPKEFNKLQAQDLGKIGATQDLLRGIEKLMPRKAEMIKEVVRETITVQTTGGVILSNLLKRAEMALEDEKWSAADDFCEQILNSDVENAEAYLYKFMAQEKLSSRRLIEQNPALLYQLNEQSKREIARARQYASGTFLQWLEKIDRLWQEGENKRRQAAEAERLRQEEERRHREEARLREEAERRRIQEEEEQERQRQLEIAENLRKSRANFQKVPNLLAAGYTWGHSACVAANGTVYSTDKPKNKRYKATLWEDIVSVAVGSFHIVGLKGDGTAVAIPGDFTCRVSGWKDIAAISASDNNTAGLKSDGTVVVSDEIKGTEKWKDIISLALGCDHIVGLKADGSVVTAGKNKKGQCDTYGWKDIVAISAGNGNTIGLKSNGTVVATGENIWGQCDVADWKNIVAISAGIDHTLGLKADGTVVTTARKKSSLTDVSQWQNIIAISAGYQCCLGLQADGTVLVAGKIKNGSEQIEGINLFESMPTEEKQAFIDSIVNTRNNFFQLNI